MRSDFDAIIVGGGPAGSSAAIHLARAGGRVLLAEQRRFPRAKLCGEFISPECLGHFARLFLHNRLIREDGALSILRGFRPRELKSLAGRAGLSRAKVERRFPYRLVLSGGK